MKKGLLALLIFAVFCLMFTSVSAQERLITTGQVNLRSGPGTNYSIVRILDLGVEIGLVQEVPGELVVMNGRSSSTWYQISSPVSGYVWSGLTSRVVLTAIEVSNPNYPDFVCGSCQYHNLVIQQMQWFDDDYNEVRIEDPQLLISKIYALHARSVWRSDVYDFDMPGDVITTDTISFTVESNVLPGPLLYRDEIHQSLTVTNDWIQIWFMYSPSTQEAYVFPFRSMTRTCTPAGEHCGEHLNGAYAVPLSDIDTLVTELRLGI